MEPQIGVVGLWHLGCTLAACWSELGMPVIAYDENGSVVENLKSAQTPIYEPGLETVLKKNMKNGRLRFTTDFPKIEKCEFVFLSYDTPVLKQDESDLSPLERAIATLRKILKSHSIVIVSSQTPVGTCGKFRKSLQTGQRGLELVYSPENIRLGDALQSYLKPGRIILGVENKRTEERVVKLFKKIPAELLRMNLASAEMVKHGINSFLAASITFANQMADLCEVSGADILDVVRGMKSDPRIGLKSYLSPGIGFSGGTLGRDLKVLENLNNGSQRNAHLFKRVYQLNAQRKLWIVEKIRKIFGNSLHHKRIGALGLTYKPGTSTLRRSLPVEIVELLTIAGAEVSIFDPKADYNEWEKSKFLQKAKSAGELVKNAEMVVILTGWPEFRALDWKNFYNKKHSQTIFDTNNFLADLHLEKIGYRYFGIGRKFQNAEN